MTSARLDIVRESRLYDWIELRSSSPGTAVKLHCTRCDCDSDPVTMPQPLHRLLANARDFVNAHRDCRPRPALADQGEVFLL